MSDSNQGWIGIDLDGTLAYFDFWQGKYHIGEPIKEMMETLHRLLAEGREVRIFTARACDPEAIPYVQAWLDKHNIGQLQITNCKDYDLDYFFDDKAVQVTFNTGLTLQEEHIRLIAAHEKLLKQTNLI